MTRVRATRVIAPLVLIPCLAFLLTLGSSGGDAAGIPDGVAAAGLDIKTRFARGVDLAIDPRSIRITGVEELPNRSFIVLLAVPDGGTTRTGAVYGLCVDPKDLGNAGGFVEGLRDPELEAQRIAASTIVCKPS